MALDVLRARQVGFDEAAIQAQITSQVARFPDHLSLLKTFISHFTDQKSAQPNSPHGKRKYLNQLQAVADGTSSVIRIEMEDLIKHFCNSVPTDAEDLPTEDHPSLLPSAMAYNAARYIQLLYEAIEAVRISETPSQNPNGFASAGQGRGMGKLQSMAAAQVPVHLRVPYEVRLIPASSEKTLPLRHIRSNHIGSLVKMEAIVTKVSSVKPKVLVAYYKCMDCDADLHQSVQSSFYMPLLQCKSDVCVRNRKPGELRMVLNDSKFAKFQELKVQEPATQVPAGSVPRNQKMIVEGSLTRQLLPGQAVTLSGILKPVAKAGHPAARNNLVADTYFEIHEIEHHKRGYNDLVDLSPDEAAEMEAVLERHENDPMLYEKLAASIAPSIHGMEDVKKILLLQLIGGTTETFSDGMKIRGDIHVLLMGDPGVAKSQLLGQICRIAPRAHYTTGKGSSGVGLTASVVRDTLTGEFTLEGGAIVLSDNGICCIDEFDKMDEYDRTAIHEVMEQQTISISKAGLTTTLNARTSILSAANPQFGRYDVNKSPMVNMNLPAALLSRFDIQFLLLDKADREKDMMLAKHVLFVHQNMRPPTQAETSGGRVNVGVTGHGASTSADGVFDAKTLRLFISKARAVRPKLPPSLISEVVEHYVDIRQRERQDINNNNSIAPSNPDDPRSGVLDHNTYTTPRTLLAILRLSQALARLRRSELVERGDFEEALRLINESKRSIVSTAEEAGAAGSKKGDPTSEIMDILKSKCKRASSTPGYSGWMSIVELEGIVVKAGLNKQQLIATIEAYVELDVLQWKDGSRAYVGFADRVAEAAAGGP